MGIGEKLKSLRAAKQLTQQQLAESLGISSTSIHKLEANVSFPSGETMVAIANYFEVSLDWLMGIKPQISDSRHRIRYLVMFESCASLSCDELGDILRAFSELDCLAIQSAFGAKALEHLDKAIVDSDYYVFFTEGDESKILVPQDIEKNLSLANSARIPCLVLVRERTLSEDLDGAKSTRAIRNIAKVRHVHGSELPDVLISGITSLRQKANSVAGWLPMADKMRSDSVYEERLETMKKLMEGQDAK